MRVTTKGELKAVQHSLRNPLTWTESDLERLADLYRERGNATLLGAVLAEIHARKGKAECSVLPLGECTLFEMEV